MKLHAVVNLLHSVSVRTILQTFCGCAPDRGGQKIAHPASPADELLAGGTNNGRVRLWNLQTGDELGVLTCGQRIISALAFSPDGQELAVAAVRGKLLLYRLPKAPAAGPKL